MSLPVYRNLLRAIRIAFSGDSVRLSAARSATREGFEANKHLQPESQDLKDSLEHARSVATILRQNLVQGKMISKDEGQTISDETKYKLNIHQHIERGDNDSVKQQTNKSGKCCSQ